MAQNNRTAVGERSTPLKAVPFFTQLTEAELDLIRSLSSEKHYPKNAVVLTEGEMGDSLYMIQSGKVKVFIGDQEGREMILKILGPGDFFGEMSMIDKQPRSASVTTLESSVFLVLSHAAFEKCLEKIPRIANMVGASREMVNRILKDLAERGFISVESKSITIINHELPPSL